MAVSIFMHFNDGWVKALTIPTADVIRMSTMPLKWLRFLCYIVLHTAGRFFPNQDDAESQAHEVDYNNANLLHEYYYLPGQLHQVWNRLNADFEI